MDKFNTFMEKSTSNTWVRGALTVFLVFYGGLAAGGLPPFMKELFKNNIFKVFIIALLAYILSEDLQIGVMVTAAFLLTIVGINAMENKETFDQMHHMITLEAFDKGQDFYMGKAEKVPFPLPLDSLTMGIRGKSMILIPDHQEAPAFTHISKYLSNLPKPTDGNGKILPMPSNTLVMDIPSESMIFTPDNKGTPNFIPLSELLSKIQDTNNKSISMKPDIVKPMPGKPFDKPIIINPDINKPLIHPVPKLPVFDKPKPPTYDKPMSVNPNINKPLIHSIPKQPIILKQSPAVLK